MLRLVLSDMDGTLLDDNKNLPDNFDFFMKKLKENNITFCAASGRGYHSLKGTFKDYYKDMLFISDNGTIVYHDDECIYYSDISFEKLKYIKSLYSSIDTCHLIYCGVNSSYCFKEDFETLMPCMIYYTTLTPIYDFSEINDHICKIAIYDEYNALKNIGHLSEFLPADLVSVNSAINWIDISNRDVSKGSATKIILEKLNIDYSETMAFGDFNNDIEMLEDVKYSFAMSNATDKVKAAAKFLTSSNNEETVTNKVLDFINLKHIDSIIFDMDGLMFDTETLAFNIWKKLLTANNLEIKEEFLYQIRGRNSNSSRILFDDYYKNSKVTYDELRNKKNELLRSYLLNNKIPYKKGLISILNYLKENNYKMVVASSTESKYVRLYLEKEQLISYFDGIIGGDEVKYSKPNKEIFEKALGLLGVSSERALVLEDSLAGILASKNANIKSILVPDNLYIDEAKINSLITLESLEEVENFLIEMKG